MEGDVARRGAIVLAGLVATAAALGLAAVFAVFGIYFACSSGEGSPTTDSTYCQTYFPVVPLVLMAIGVIAPIAGMAVAAARNSWRPLLVGLAVLGAVSFIGLLLVVADA